jgi:hypothetical protein
MALAAIQKPYRYLRNSNMGIVRDGFLSAEMKRVYVHRNSLSEQFDLALIASGSDRRCMSMLGFIPQADRCILLTFTGNHDQSLSATNESELISYYRAKNASIDRISGDALDIDAMWPRIWASIQECYSEKRRPLRVLIDLSTCPRIYSLASLAGLLRVGMARRLTVFYAEGRYDATKHPTLSDYPFHVGHWKAVPIPFLEGIADPGKKSHFVVSVGFEGTRTARVLAKEDPDRVSLLFPKPGVKAKYVREAEERNRRLVEEYRIPKDEIVNARAGDAVEAWRKLTAAAIERPETEEVAYLCCGTKPHSLAMALRAICLQYPIVLYNLPEGPSFVDVYATGVYRRFDITDLSAPNMENGA